LSDKIRTEINCLNKFTLPYYKLKELLRTGWVQKLGIENSESVASHTLLMIIIVLYLSSKYSYSCKKKLKLIEMVLVHDVAESLIGDITPETMDILKKKEMEDEAFSHILKNVMPNNLKAELSAAWNEYQDDKTIDSKLVHLVDKLEMILQANFYQENKKNVTYEKIAPFKKSVSSFVNKNYNYKGKMNFKINSNRKRELNEIKEILAYLCK
jgi:putative hydrolases of HD superfamily